MKNNKKKIVLIVAAIVAVLLVVGGMVYYFVFANLSPKEFYERTLNEANAIYQNQFDKMGDTTGGKMTMNFKSNSTDETMKLLNEINLSIDYSMDMKNNQMIYNLDSKYENKELIKGTFFMNNNKIYVNLDGITDNYLYTETDELDGIFKNTNKEAKILVNSVVNAINVSLKDEYFIASKEDGYKLYIMDLDEKQTETLITDIVNNLKKDKEFIKSAAKLYGLKESVIKDNLEDKIKVEKDTTIKTVLYAKNNKVKKVAFDIDIDGSKVGFVLEEKGQEIADFDFMSDGKKVCSGTIMMKETKDNTKCELVAKVEDVTLIINMTSEYSKKFESPSVEKAKDMNSLSEKELYGMMMKLYQKEGFVKLFTIINSLSPNSGF